MVALRHGHAVGRWNALFADLVAAAQEYRAARQSGRFPNPAGVTARALALWRAEAEAPCPPVPDRLAAEGAALRQAALRYGDLSGRADLRRQWEAFAHLLACCVTLPS